VKSLKIIKFEKDNCPSCQLVSNYLDNKGVEYEKVNVFDRPEQAMTYEIMGVPVTILLDDNGNEVKRVAGFKVSELEELISQLN
jgi:thioredoxin 1